MDSWMAMLSQAGYRVTMPRRAIAEALLGADTPLAADEILERGRLCHGRLGLVTVYRTLALYEELGLVCRVHLREGCHGYVATTPGHRHVLLCQRCGRSVEFAGRDDLDTLVADLEHRTGYRVSDHLLQLFGLCPSCNQATA